MATFNSWLKKQVDRRDHVGDLADDIVNDVSLPASKEGWLQYLEANNACRSAICAFHRVWSEYEALKARHGRRTSTTKCATDEVSMLSRCLLQTFSRLTHPLFCLSQDPEITGMRAALAEAHFTLIPVSSRSTWQAKVCVPLARLLNDRTNKGAPRQATRSRITEDATSPASARMALYRLAALDLSQRLQDQDKSVCDAVLKAVTAVKDIMPPGHPHRRELQEALHMRTKCSLG